MTDEQINIAIAEACGWTDAEIIGKENPTPFGIMPNERNEGDNYRLIPNYCNDLNAMHEAEKVFVYKPESVIGRSTRSEYENHIATICGDFRWGVSATARQRAEAFLRTLGKWEES